MTLRGITDEWVRQNILFNELYLILLWFTIYKKAILKFVVYVNEYQMRHTKWGLALGKYMYVVA